MHNVRHRENGASFFFLKKLIVRRIGFGCVLLIFRFCSFNLFFLFLQFVFGRKTALKRIVQFRLKTEG
jgi:hypothetical protein